MYVGNFDIDDALTFVVNTHAVVGDASDADSVPTYRVYEDETTTAILTGSMALLDSANTTGLYSEQLTLSAANGFELGKCYTIYISATVGGITGTTVRQFQMSAVSVDAAAIAAAVEVELMNEGTGGAFMQAIADKLAAEFDIEEVGIVAIRDAILDRVLPGNHDVVGSTAKYIQQIADVYTAAQVIQGEVENIAAEFAEFPDPTTGGGDIVVTHDTGGTDALRYVDEDDNGIEGFVTAYLTSEYDADSATATPRGQTRTGSDGRWTVPMMLFAGPYTFAYDAPGYRLSTVEQEVE
jgi:hypothetical protein